MIPSKRPMRPPLAVPTSSGDSVPSFSTSCPSSPRTTTTASCTPTRCLGVELLEQRECVIRLAIVVE